MLNSCAIHELFNSHGKSISRFQINPLQQEGLILVKSGLSKIFGVTEKGEPINTDLIFESELYWVTEANYRSESAFFIEPMRHSALLFIPQSAIGPHEQRLLPGIMMKFYRERLKRIHQQKIRNYGLDLKERLFYMLSDFCLIYGKRVGAHYAMPNFFTHEDLANMLRNCRQNITASLNELKKEGHLNYDRKKILFDGRQIDKRKAVIPPHLSPKQSTILENAGLFELVG
jgi:CRP-like cAMP-binding protein